ncbi:hypothetical protein DB346_04570 [Verrucomicrobia bacterium LW23]|nr:hypothetical protein DB346_04570 [Verrucomicrobia bacterium LW23]
MRMIDIKSKAQWFSPSYGTCVGIIFLLAFVGVPCFYGWVVYKHFQKQLCGPADLQNIRQLGIVLTAVSADSPEQCYPFRGLDSEVAATSTDVFNRLVKERAIRNNMLVFSPGPGKWVLKGDGKLTSANVGYNYMKAEKDGKTEGIPLYNSLDLPLLWSAGNAPIAVPARGPGDLKLLDTGVWGRSSVVVYTMENTAKFMRVKKDAQGKEETGIIRGFIRHGFERPDGYRFSELIP